MAVRHGVHGVPGTEETLAPARAAEELGLKPEELDLAVRLDEVRTVTEPGSGRRRVPRAEVSRLTRGEGFPWGLRECVRLLVTAAAAELMGITPERFTRLAKVGCFSPVTFRINRYRAVVWLYAAVELRTFAARHPGLLTGSTPKNLRSMLDAGEDWRARNWRSRRIGQLARQAEDPWERAAVSAAVLGPEELAAVVGDPAERDYLRGLRPALVPVPRVETPTWSVVRRLITADDPDEVLWHRIGLVLSLEEARAARSAPDARSDGMPRPEPPDGADPLGEPAPREPTEEPPRSDECGPVRASAATALPAPTAPTTSTGPTAPAAGQRAGRAYVGGSRRPPGRKPETGSRRTPAPTPASVTRGPDGPRRRRGACGP
ncbi:DUF6397 family protein [Streptomyces sp. NPDC002055]|uniref:DUF6397 family protein n=1 Tax=Streptomyces sp. NPDC002055 TaxID=3154534 RepID=UPI0033207927